jgi:hypothetical protein
MRKLILLNGRWNPAKREHIYICAHSKADAARMMVELAGGTVSSWLYEIKHYFNECWGNAMSSKITPERGAWVRGDRYDSPVKKVL